MELAPFRLPIVEGKATPDIHGASKFQDTWAPEAVALQPFG